MNEFFGCNILDFDNVDTLRQKLVDEGMFPMSELEDLKSLPTLVDYVYKRKIRDKIIQPTFLYNYPTYMVPLARHNDKDDRCLDMYQLLVAGAELSKGYSELVNPIQQLHAFEEQAKNIADGDEEAFNPDNDFVCAVLGFVVVCVVLGFVVVCVVLARWVLVVLVVELIILT